MDKNTITGIILMAVVVIGFSWYSQPSEEERRLMAQQDSIAAVEKLNAEKATQEQKQKVAEAKAEQAADSTTLFFAQRQGQEQEVVLKNNKVKVTLSTLGGTIQNAEIIGYKSRNHEGDVMLMTRKDAQMTFSLAGKQENIISSDLFFTPTEQTDSSVVMVAEQDGKQLCISYQLLPNSYMVNMQLQAKGLSGFFAPDMKTLDISWTDRIMQQEKGYDFENRYSSLTYMRKDDGTKKLSETSNDTEDPEEALSWVAFRNQFFSAVLIAPQDFTNVHLSSTQETEKKNGYLKTYEAEMKTFFDPSGSKPTELQMYLGPNEFHTLKAHNKLSKTEKNPELEDIVYLGWFVFRLINRWLIMPLFHWLSSFGMNMGLVLMLLTVIVKLLVYPSNKKSYMSSAKMRVLKPQVDAISAKYPKQEDAMRRQQETMQFYSQYGVSPMGGCLPMLLQMPIWFALFTFVPSAIELRGESFLWADDLSAYDDIIRWSSDLWLIGDHLSLFSVIYLITGAISTWIGMRTQQSQMSGEMAQQMKMMRYMSYIMPLMFFFLFNNYSSGLCFYFVVSSIATILITWYLRLTTDDAKLLAKLEAYREQHKNDPKKVSNLAARLEALQKMQAEQQAARKK